MKKKLFFYKIFAIAFLFFSCTTKNVNASFEDLTGFQNWENWKKKCLIPNNSRSLKTFKNDSKKPAISLHELQTIIDFYLSASLNLLLTPTWLSEPIFKIDIRGQELIPDLNAKYAQKIIIEKNATILTVGDLHGNFNDLCKIIDQWIDYDYLDKNLKLKKNIYVIMLGDYADRGMSGTEVLATLMLLKITNPNKVFLCRGNHEYLDIMYTYGFLFEFNEIWGEILKKYHKEISDIQEELIDNLDKLLSTMPTIIYLANPYFQNKKFAQFNHAGIDERFNPAKLLIQKRSYFQRINIEYRSGFEWSDIKRELEEKKESSRMVENVFDYPPRKIIEILKKQNISFKIGGHQHNEAKKIISSSELNSFTEGTIDIGTESFPILITMGGSQSNKHIPYYPTYVIIKPDENEKSGWFYKTISITEETDEELDSYEESEDELDYYEEIEEELDVCKETGEELYTYEESEDELDICKETGEELYTYEETEDELDIGEETGEELYIYEKNINAYKEKINRYEKNINTCKELLKKIQSLDQETCN